MPATATTATATAATTAATAATTATTPTPRPTRTRPDLRRGTYLTFCLVELGCGSGRREGAGGDQALGPTGPRPVHATRSDTDDRTRRQKARRGERPARCNDR